MSEDAGTGAEGTEGAAQGAAEGAENGSEAGDLSGPAANTWWQFPDQSAAEKWANDLVTKRLSRERKTKLDPVLQERDTLKAELDQLRPLKEATQTDAERWESKFQQVNSELEQLRSYRSQQERSNLVRQIADEVGLPASFHSRIRGDDEDSIREDAQDLLNVLSEGGSNTGTKKAPPQKAPKPESKGGGSVSSGGGGKADEPSDDELAKDIISAVSKQRRTGGLVAVRR